MDQSNPDFTRISDDINTKNIYINIYIYFFKTVPWFLFGPHDESSLVTELQDAKIPTRCEGHDLQIIGLKQGWGFFREPCAFLSSVTMWLAVRPLERKKKEKEKETHNFHQPQMFFLGFLRSRACSSNERKPLNSGKWPYKSFDWSSDLILWFSDPQMITAAERLCKCELCFLESMNFCKVKGTESYRHPLSAATSPVSLPPDAASDPSFHSAKPHCVWHLFIKAALGRTSRLKYTRLISHTAGLQ